MIDVRMRDHEAWEGHEVPRLRSEIEAQFEFRDSPIGLDGGPRIAVDSKLIVFEAQGRRVVNRADGFCQLGINALRRVGGSRRGSRYVGGWFIGHYLLFLLQTTSGHGAG